MSLTDYTLLKVTYSRNGFFFFFSSRRRHTRYWRDWSSDVCSSDLATSCCAPCWELRPCRHALGSRSTAVAGRSGGEGRAAQIRTPPLLSFVTLEIGRASCRERV